MSHVCDRSWHANFEYAHTQNFESYGGVLVYQSITNVSFLFLSQS